MYDAAETADKINRGQIEFTGKSRLFWIPVVLIIIIILAAFIFGMAGSSSNYQWVQYSNYGISFNHPSSIPINTSAAGYSVANLNKGTLQFDNPDHQGIFVSWFPKGSVLSQTVLQKFFTTANTALIKDAPDLNSTSIQVMTHSGDTIFYVNEECHDITLDGKMAYDVIGIWEDPPSQRDYIIATVSYKSQDDAQSLFNGVLNSIEFY